MNTFPSQTQETDLLKLVMEDCGYVCAYYGVSAAVKISKPFLLCFKPLYFVTTAPFHLVSRFLHAVPKALAPAFHLPSTVLRVVAHHTDGHAVPRSVTETAPSTLRIAQDNAFRCLGYCLETVFRVPSIAVNTVDAETVPARRQTEAPTRHETSCRAVVRYRSNVYLQLVRISDFLNACRLLACEVPREAVPRPVFVRFSDPLSCPTPLLRKPPCKQVVPYHNHDRRCNETSTNTLETMAAEDNASTTTVEEKKVDLKGGEAYLDEPKFERAHVSVSSDDDNDGDDITTAISAALDNDVTPHDATYRELTNPLVPNRDYATAPVSEKPTKKIIDCEPVAADHHDHVPENFGSRLTTASDAAINCLRPGMSRASEKPTNIIIDSEPVAADDHHRVPENFGSRMTTERDTAINDLRLGMSTTSEKPTKIIADSEPVAADRDDRTECDAAINDLLSTIANDNSVVLMKRRHVRVTKVSITGAAPLNLESVLEEKGVEGEAVSDTHGSNFMGGDSDRSITRDSGVQTCETASTNGNKMCGEHHEKHHGFVCRAKHVFQKVKGKLLNGVEAREE